MPRSKKNKKKKSQNAAVDAEDATSKMKQIEPLIEEAEAAVDSFNYDEAEAKFKEALKIDENNCKCLEMLSSIYLEQFKWSEAQTLLKRCIDLSPESGFSKYFSLAQICEGLESVKYYEKGIEILQKELENVENIEPSKEQNKSTLLRSLSDAYCSISEIFMTDCCFEENAEDRCVAAIDSSIKSDPSNPEAYLCQASFRVVKDQIEEAKQSLQKSLSFWLPSLEDEDDEEDTEKKLQAMPLYDSRIKASKLLIEVEMFYEASKVLESLLQEDDEVVEVWYLLGWSNYIRGDDEYKRNARFYLRKAKQVSTKVGCEDDECIEHTHELLQELDSLYPDDSDEENEENINDDELSLDSQSDEEMET